MGNVTVLSTPKNSADTSVKFFSQKKVFVVDDQHQFLVMIKGMLTTLGVNKIDAATSAEQALKICRHQKYDIYLFDYNIGSGMNGRQLMERLRQEKHIPYDSIVMIVTGDNSRAMVLSAIEQEPDDYMIKPFSQFQFKQRILKAIQKRLKLSEIYKAQFEDDVPNVISHLEEYIPNNTEYLNYARCLLSAYYVKIEDFEKAVAVLEEGLAHNNSTYLHLYLGKVHYAMKLYQKAIEEFELVISKHPLMVEALRFMTYSYIEQHHPDIAMQTIKKAVALSPMSVQILSLQIELALKNKDFLTARDSIAMLIDVNKCYPKDVENLLASFVQCELQFVQNTSDQYHISNMSKQIRNVVTRYKKNLNLDSFNYMLFDEVCNSREQIVLGEHLRAKRMLYKAYTQCEKPEDIALPIINQIYIGFQQVGEYEIADQIKSLYIDPKQEAEKTSDSFSELTMNILNSCSQSYIDDSNFNERRAKYNELNEQGIEAYKMGKLDEALKLFTEALKKVPTNTNAILNKVQVLLETAEIEQKNNKKHHMIALLISDCNSNLLSLEGLNLTEAQNARTKQLRSDLENFKKIYKY